MSPNILSRRSKRSASAFALEWNSLCNWFNLTSVPVGSDINLLAVAIVDSGIGSCFRSWRFLPHHGCGLPLTPFSQIDKERATHRPIRRRKNEVSGGSKKRNGREEGCKRERGRRERQDELQLIYIIWCTISPHYSKFIYNNVKIYN